MQFFKRLQIVANRGSNDRSTDTTVPPTASSSTSKPSTVITSASSQHLLPKDNQVSPLTLKDGSKGLGGRNIGHRGIEDAKSHQSSDPRPPTMTAPSWNPSRSANSTYANNPDMYTQNDLNTFSFGAAPSTFPSTSSPQPVDPLFRPRDEADLDDVAQIPDTTPRPSVVGNVLHRTHPSHSERHEERSTPSRHRHLDRAATASQKYKEPDSDTASNFGTSSASASLSSLSQPRWQNYRSTSQVSGRSSDVALTSLNDSTSDEEPDGRHPFPPGALEPRPRAFRNRDKESSLYLSEEDFEKYNDEFDQEAGESDVNNESRPPINGYDYSDVNRESPHPDHSERRGSLARDIPGAQSDRFYVDNSPRNNYTRRPSRSLEELKLFSFTASRPQNAGCSTEDKSPPIEPTSIPGSEGNWRELRKKSVQHDKDLPPILSPNMSANVASSSNTSNNVSAPNGSSSPINLDWINYGQNGVVTLDPSEMSDIVGVNPSFTDFRKGSSSTYRRQSTVSSGVDIFNKRSAGWAGATSKSLKPLWVWAIEKPDEELSNRQLGDTRERSSISTLFLRPSTSNGSGSELSRTGSKAFEKPDKEKAAKESKEKAAGKDKQKEPWRGMALDSDEIWANAALGRFRVSRRNATSNEPGKAPPQRLNVALMRTPVNLHNNLIPPSHVFEGPAITIHKHSKASAFSISRHFRPRNATRPQDTSLSLRNTTRSAGQTTMRESDTGEDGRKKGNHMILLAPRRIQKAYTNTNTTQKLESHGLLDESGRTSDRDIARMRQEHEREERRRAKDGNKKKEKEKGKGTHKDIIKRKAESSSSRRSISSKCDIPLNKPSPQIADASEDSSVGSVAKALSSSDSEPVTTIMGLLTPDSSAGSVAPQPSILSQETISLDRTAQRNIYRSHQRKRGVYNIDDDDEDEDDDSSDHRPTRTPHHETYTTLPPEVLEDARQETQSHGLFGLGKYRSGDRNGRRVKSYLQEPYNPPWRMTQTRVNSEQRKYILEDLNTSFQDVGLLPAVGEIKGSSQISDHKRKENRDQQHGKQAKRAGDKQSIDIFEEVPADALYMLLPLWPGDTDSASAKNYPYMNIPIPTDNRLYLIVYYKNFAKPQEETSKTKSSDKKRSRESPANSGDNDRSVLLSNFTISARMVSYRELQGTNVRIPDLGLAVFGRLEDAYNTRPSDLILGDYVIGMCHSHEAGVEFYPEGFDKLNLATHVPYRGAMEPTDDDDSQSTEIMTALTPIGRAVMEMAWLGAMALTSFNPNL